MKAWGIRSQNRSGFRTAIMPIVSSLNPRKSKMTKLLRDFEISATKKQCPLNGNTSLGFIPDTGWPFPYSENKEPDLYREAFRSLFENIKNHALANQITKVDYDAVMSGNHPVRYRRNSNYGILTNMAGSDRNSDLCLGVHAMICKQMYNDALNNPEILKDNDTYAAYLIKQLKLDPTYHHLVAIQLLSRKQAVKPDRLNFSWTIDGQKKVLTPHDPSTSIYPRLRWVQAVPAFQNMLFTPLAAHITELLHNTPVFTVGHQVSNSHLLRQMLIRCGATRFHCYDLDRYDSTVGADTLEVFIDELIDAFSTSKDPNILKMFDRLIRLSYCVVGIDPRSSDYIEASRANIFDETNSTFLKYKYKSGVLSGEQLTTLKGTLIHVCSIAICISRLKKVSVTDAINCFDMCSDDHACIPLMNGFTWSACVKSDDIAFCSTNDEITMNDLVKEMSALGFSVAPEEITVFLMNAIDVTEEFKYTSESYVGLPVAYEGMMGLRSYGFLSRRIGSSIFPEYPTDSDIIACIGIVERVRGIQLHPLYDAYSVNISRWLDLAFTNAGFSGVTDLRKADAAIKTPKAQAMILDYIEKKGSSDSFLRDAINRYNAGIPSGINDELMALLQSSTDDSVSTMDCSSYFAIDMNWEFIRKQYNLLFNN